MTEKWPSFFAQRIDWLHIHYYADLKVTQVHQFSEVKPQQGVMLKRIPFYCMKHLHKVVERLRQQLTFNTLFQSCFHANVYLHSRRFSTPSSLEDKEEGRRVYVDVIVVRVPEEFHLVLRVDGSDAQASLIVHVGETNDITVKQIPNSDGRKRETAAAALKITCDDAQGMKHVVETAGSIPTLVHWIIHRFHEAVQKKAIN